VRVNTKEESYGALAHRLASTYATLKAAELTIDGLREAFAEDAAELAQVRAHVVGAIARVGTATCRAADLVPTPSQPANHKPISET